MPFIANKQSLLMLPRSVKRAIVISIDIFVCGFSVLLAFWLRLDHWSHLQAELCIVFITALVFFHSHFLFILVCIKLFLDMLDQILF